VSERVASPPSAEAVETYRARIERHLVRLAQGHDPWGHLFAIERLARAARAESYAARRPAGGQSAAGSHAP
jgi:hypothetical protein